MFRRDTIYYNFSDRNCQLNKIFKLKSDVALKTYQRRRAIGRSGKRGSGISVPAARHDDDDDDDVSYHLVVKIVGMERKE